ncbi:hypothetical protein A6770_14955 [Nostoc minutum NIES-26]|uniref:Uncharacterized protein n=1 Tax=Nostoc minutum NIES-26 TaxID=1844469 RepID=A0A367RML4_9NOSO|nr:hypothetical protein A6770_14955 [Nostoc minutum NIES-26]
MVKQVKGGKIRDFDPLKHPRGRGGRFSETPDQPKDPKKRFSAKGGLKEAKRAATISLARLEILRTLTPEQRAKVARILEAKRLAQELASKPTVSKTELRKQSSVIRDTKRSAKTYQARLELIQSMSLEQRRRFNQVLRRSQASTEGKYLAATPQHLTIKGTKLVIWDGKPELAKAQGGFKTKKVRDFEYAVEVNGERVVLNRQTKMHEFMGERIYGMPSLNPRLAAMTPTQLADGLAKYMTKVETKDTTVPDWLPTFHGKVDKSLLKNGYGKMQQHHIHQWAKVPLENIVRDYDSGKITLEEAKSQTRAILSRETIKTKSGKEKEDWVLTPADKDQRSFVVLPGGLHDISNKPLYWANHPMGIDVDSPDFKLRPYRLPKHGDSGRDWHSSTFRPGSWLEIYRRESYVLLGEINRRINRNELTPQEAQKLFTEGLAKVDKANQYKLKYSKNP